jgi:hypothetical protein
LVAREERFDDRDAPVVGFAYAVIWASDRVALAMGVATCDRMLSDPLD